MARKLLSISRLRKKAWVIFSQYIRRNAANAHGIVYCVTCGSPHIWKDAQAGHFIHGMVKASCFAEDNIHVQCVRCNKYLSGNLIKYETYLVSTIGQERVDQVKYLSHLSFKPDRKYYDDIIAKYQELLKGLDNGDLKWTPE